MIRNFAFIVTYTFFKLYADTFKYLKAKSKKHSPTFASKHFKITK